MVGGLYFANPLNDRAIELCGKLMFVFCLWEGIDFKNKENLVIMKNREHASLWKDYSVIYVKIYLGLKF